MASVYVADGTETRAQRVGCSAAVNTGMRGASTLAKVSKEKLPNRLPTPGHRDTKEGKAHSKISSAHKEGCNYSDSNPVMRAKVRSN